MANLQLLRKRLKSINATGELASAMKTVATVKYSKISKTTSEFREYSDACAEILNVVAPEAFVREKEPVKRSCLIVISSNRGFCGGYNSELFKFADEQIQKEEFEDGPLLIACGKKIQSYYEEKGIRAVPYEISDIPTLEEAKAITQFVLDIYLKGEAEKVCFVYQKFKNMMTQIPTLEQLLPRDEVDKNTLEEILYLPDRKTFSETLAFDCLSSRVYGILLGCASGAQASTVIAMKSACDNAEESSQQLEMTINRLRQAQVTNSVIETSSGMAAANMEK